MYYSYHQLPTGVSSPADASGGPGILVIQKPSMPLPTPSVPQNSYTVVGSPSLKTPSLRQRPAQGSNRRST